MSLSKRMIKIRPAIAFPFIIGVFTGTLLTTFLVLALRTMDGRESAFLPHESSLDIPLVASPPSLTVSPPKSRPPSLLMRKTISYNVLSTKEQLQRRVLPIHRTWGSKTAIEYYLYPPGGEEEVNFAAKKKFPLISLGTTVSEMEDAVGHKGVSRMWESICERKITQYRWFMKLTDDVYVRTSALENLLSSLNSSEPLLIGRPVYPTGAARDKLGLREGEGYCMESGYIVSWGAMERLCAGLPWCQENAKSENEDVEIARCIRIYSRANCTAANEMEELFYNADDEIDQEQLQLGDHHLNPSITRALTVSPLKEPDHFYHFHSYQANSDLREKKQVVKKLRTHLLEIADLSAKSTSLLHPASHHSPSWTKLGVTPPHFPEEEDEQVIHFQMYDDRYKYTESLHYPVHTTSSDERKALREITDAVTGSLANRTTGSELKFQSTALRFDPQRGIDYFSHVLDVSHQQSMLVHSLREVELPRVLSVKPASYRTTKVNFVVAAPSVSRGFQRFMMSFENSFLARNPPESVGLLVVLYSDDGRFKHFDEDLHAVTTLVDLYKNKYPTADLRYVSTRNTHSRLETLSTASREFPSFELLFLADIHIDFSTRFLERCRMNAVEGKQAYFPVVFNPYDPDQFYKARILYPHATKFQISPERGNWMHDSYHIACVYNYDLTNALQFQEERNQDLTLVEMFLKLSKLSVFRSVEPGLVHLWQDGCHDEHMGPSESTLCEKLDYVIKTS